MTQSNEVSASVTKHRLELPAIWDYGMAALFYPFCLKYIVKHMWLFHFLQNIFNKAMF